MKKKTLAGGMAVRWSGGAVIRSALLAGGISMLLAGCGGGSGHSHHDDDHDHDHDVATAGAVRALVAGSDDMLRMYDLDGGEQVASFHMPDVSGLTTTHDGRFGIIGVRGEEQSFRLMDSGVWVLDHIDHVHLEVDPPRLFDEGIDGATYGGSRPAHVVSRDGRVSMFFDGVDPEPSVAVTVDIQDLEWGFPQAPQVLVGNGHHGLAVPGADNTVIMSVAEGEGRARTGLRVHDANGSEVAGFAGNCPGLHGYAVIGDDYLFGCHRDQGEGGVWMIRYQADAAHPSDHFVGQRIDYPASGAHVSNFAYHAKLDVAVGTWGGEAFMRVDPSAAAMTDADRLDLPARQCGYALRDDQADQLLVLTVDGVLRAYEVSTWNEVASKAVMDPFECSMPRPTLASVGHYAYLTRPATSDLIEVDLEEGMTLHRVIDLPATPERMTLFRHPAGLVDYGDH